MQQQLPLDTSQPSFYPSTVEHFSLVIDNFILTGKSSVWNGHLENHSGPSSHALHFRNLKKLRQQAAQTIFLLQSVHLLDAVVDLGLKAVI